mmetsp:Transcript_12556/g.30516  ORF Transcript_12556/g.30516 Transcript_12556/m.30516 type:complete len:209 (+) Transcript_12556:738-1364(+)
MEEGADQAEKLLPAHLASVHDCGADLRQLRREHRRGADLLHGYCGANPVLQNTRLRVHRTILRGAIGEHGGKLVVAILGGVMEPARHADCVHLSPLYPAGGHPRGQDSAGASRVSDRSSFQTLKSLKADRAGDCALNRAGRQHVHRPAPRHRGICDSGQGDVFGAFAQILRQLLDLILHNVPVRHGRRVGLGSSAADVHRTVKSPEPH